MKNFENLPYIFGFILLISCSGNDDSLNNSSLNSPPDNFALLEVRNNSTDISLNPQLSWGRATDPDGDMVTYQVLLDEGTGNPTNVLASNLQTTEYIVGVSLITNTLYSWQVIASDGNDGTTVSEIFSFTTRENLPPENFNLLQVPNNKENIVLRPVLTWENAIDPEGGPVTYDLLLDAGDDNPTTVIAAAFQSTSFEITNDLDHNTLHSWKVIANDNQGNTVSSETFSFTTRKFRETLVTSQAQFSTRTEHSLIEFDGKLWVIGGYHASNGSVNGGLLNDVWSSVDGITWTEVVPNNSSTSFPPRTNHTTVVYQNKIWVIGGGGINSLLNDVWSSPDGVNWTQENDNTEFTARFGHTSVIFNNKIWIIGGEDGTFEFNDVWSSADGINWTLMTNNASFPARYLHTSTVFKGKMWVLGGINSVQGGGLGDLNDVWSSSDGVNWELETINADFSPRRGHSTSVYKDRIWVIAGDLKNDLWSSKDGIIWNQETETINFSGRGEQANLVFDDKLWVVGGWMGSLLNDVWFFN